MTADGDHTMAAPSLRQSLRYRFDTFMARGGSSIFLSLVLVFLGLFGSLVLLRALVLWWAPAGVDPVMGSALARHAWVLFLQLTDPGNMNQDSGSGVLYKFTAVLAGLSGVIILSMLIAFVTTGLDQLLQGLRKGHSRVIEEDHTLILGWSDRVIEILTELVLANESEPDACVVILADRDKEEMDDFLAVNFPDRRTTRVVTRSGNTSNLVNLQLASVDTARSVIALAHCPESSDRAEMAASDARVLKTLLGLSGGRAEDRRRNVVAELFHMRSREVAAGISADIHSLDAQEILAKILVQTSRSVGLSVVYSEILSFDGCEMYFHHAAWGERAFGELQLHFPDGVPLGIRRPGGEILLNPPATTRLGPEDDILILAQDDSTIEFRAHPVATPRALPLRQARARKGLERELLIGWNPRAPRIVREYADYLEEGSAIDIVLDEPDGDVRAQIALLQHQLPSLRIGIIDADPMDSGSLVEVRPFGYDNVVVLSQGNGRSDGETVDAETILVLLLLRQIFDAEALSSTTCETKLISEVMDSRNQDLVTRAGVNDFIISNRLVSMLLAQVSEEGDMLRVYQQLFSEDGSEIYLKDVALYLEDLPREVRFVDLMALAQRRGEVCLGLKLKRDEHDPDRNFGVTLIPDKNASFELDHRDSLVVLAEDET